jgi:beta-glucanase (GH16 family)
LVKNNEQQYYTPKNVYLKDGKLILKSAKQRMGGRPYTSGLVETKGRFTFQYGRVEVRAKLPGTKGLWPAHWMMPERGSWPPEIDIMELVGNKPNVIHMTNHYGVWPHNRYDTKVYSGPDYTGISMSLPLSGMRKSSAGI